MAVLVFAEVDGESGPAHTFSCGLQLDKITKDANVDTQNRKKILIKI